MPLRLYNNGVSNIVGYSIWFDGPDKTTGKLAFGAIDTGRFSGVLETLPIQLSSSTSLSYTFATIQMTAMSASKSGIITNFTGAAIPVQADTGSSAFGLPSNLFTQLVVAIGAVMDQSVRLPVIKKSDYTNDTILMLTFGSTTIHVPVDDFAYSINSTWIGFLLAASTNEYYLGIPFFRNALVIFDYSHNQVSLAPSVASSTSNLTKISQNGVAGLASTAQIAVNSTGNSTSNNTTTNTHPSALPSQSSNGGLTTASKIGIGVGIGLGIPIILALVAGIVFLRRKHRNEQEPSVVAEVVNVGDYHNSKYPTTHQRYDTGGRNFMPSELSTSSPSTYGGSTIH